MSNAVINKKEIEENTESLETKLVADRRQWGSKISELVQDIKQVDKIAEVQVSMLSYRQVLVEKIPEIKSLLYKKNTSFDNYYKILFRDYSLNYDIKLTGGEKEKMIRSDLAPIRRQINLLEAHLDFYGECMRTLDNMAFAIKNRITLHTNDSM
jgi:hypothetical protein